MSGKEKLPKRDYDKILIDFSERFYQLRHDNRNTKESDKKKPFKEISDEIYELTNGAVSISHTQLAKYYKVSEDSDDDEIAKINPSVKSVVAIADYYNVPLEYLLGLSNTKSYEDKHKIGSNVFGLSDISMTILEDMKNNSHIFNVEGTESNVYKKFGGSDLVNFLLDNLLYELQDCFNRYFYELQRLRHIEKINEETELLVTNIKESIKEKTNIKKEIDYTKDLVNYRKYKISQLVNNFIEKLCQEVDSRDNEKEVDE